MGGVIRAEVLPLAVDSDVVLLRHAVRVASGELNFTIIEATKMITAACELARNTLVHAGGGEVHLDFIAEGARSGLRLTFVDRGPGIADLERALSDGYSTNGGLGLGLGGSRRLVDEFDIVSRPGEGTRVTITRWK